MMHRHPPECEQQAALPFDRQCLPNRAGATFDHRAIQASAPRRTMPGTQAAGVRRVVSTLQRCFVWDIEQLFRTMKTQSFDIEALRTETEPPLRRLVMATLIAAVTVQQLLHARDGATARPLSDVVDPEDRVLLEALNRSVEGSTAKQRNPHPPGTLAYDASPGGVQRLMV